MKKFSRKSYLLGLIVLIVVFAGLMAYRQASAQPQGDIIVTENGQSAASKAEDIPVSNESTTEVNQAQAESTNEVNQAQAVIFVDIGGAVRTSGLFALPVGCRIADAIEAAGGLTEDADIKYLNRATVLIDGDRLYVPTASETLDGTAPPSAGQVTKTGGADAAQVSSRQGLVNINTADAEELQVLNGVGPSTAQKIIDYRTDNGGFKSIEDLMNVSGIGAKTYEKFKEHITV